MKEQLQSTINRITEYLRELMAAPQAPAFQPIRIEVERPQSRRINHRE